MTPPPGPSPVIEAGGALDAPPGLPMLVSYPRTGSHWLRCFLEMHFDRPLLPSSFFDHGVREPLLVHTHDEDLSLDEARPAVYLWREPVATVFSQLTFYYGRAADLPAAIIGAAAEHYRAHLRKWLLSGAGRGACMVTYESLRDDPWPALGRIVRFLGGDGDEGRIREVWPRVTPGLVREKTARDGRIMGGEASKGAARERFALEHGGFVRSFFEGDGGLRPLLFGG